VQAITWWDFSDLRAWQGAPAGFLRNDMTPKPMYQELQHLIHGKWWTTAELHSDAAGTADFRGFLGDYQVTVRVSRHPAVVLQTRLQKGTANRWVAKIEGYHYDVPSSQPAIR
jgi:hypothetical protein